MRDRAGERLEMVKSLPKQQFEVDVEPKDLDATLEDDRVIIPLNCVTTFFLLWIFSRS